MEKSSFKERIEEKITEIEKFLEELYDYFTPLNLELEDYKRDYKIKAICERYCEKIIEAIEDLGFLIINLKQLKYPEYEKEVFDILKDNKIISENLSKKLKEAKGMRNFIAHQYGKVDDELVFNSISEDLEKDTKEFIKSIELSFK
jgi:uncharacterized protein YutE (UPF0331/DUF86 family)